MADAEPIRDHVLLGELALHPVGPNSMPQRTEEPCIVRRDLSAGTHISSLGLHEQKHHEQKCVLNGTAPASVIASQMQGNGRFWRFRGGVLASLPRWYCCRRCRSYPCLTDRNRVCLIFRPRYPVSLLARTVRGLFTNGEGPLAISGCAGIGQPPEAYDRP